MAVPTLTYMCENWTINRSYRRRIETAEMKFLRSVAGYTILDKKYSQEIRDGLKIDNLMERIDKTKQNWYEHIKIMNPSRLPYMLLHYKPSGKRNIGRPLARFEDSIS